MTKTGLLALADALMNVAVSEGDWTAPATAAGILRKLAALEPVAWQWAKLDQQWSIDRTFSSEVFVTTVDSRRRALFDLTGVLDE